MPEPRGPYLLPLPLPERRMERSILFAVRRMAAHGIHDVSATWLMIDLFSTRFRRPLVLLRAFLLELAHAASGSISIAPCCAPRMTEDEGLLMLTLSAASNDRAAAEDALVRLTGSTFVFEPLSAAVVFGRVLEERPLAKPG